MASYPTTVPLIVNGTPVDAGNTNPPLVALTQRTDWLKAQLAALAAGTSLVLTAQTVQSGTLPGSPVYFDETNNRFQPGLASVDATTYNIAGIASYWMGIATNVNGTVADIHLVGVLTLSTVQWAAVIDGGVFAVGDYFLSETNPGLISTSPGSLGVYIGHLRADGSMIVKAGSGDSFLQHVHQKVELLAEPAGGSPDPGFGNPQTISPITPADRGWLPATNTYFPGYVAGVQIPTGAQFGYNIQHSAETALRAIFPPIPAGAAQFMQSGLILESNKIVVNDYGIWWMDNTYGNAPWPVDYDTSLTADPITLWSTRITAQASIASSVQASILAYLSGGGLAAIGVTKIISANDDDLGVTGTTGSIPLGYQGAVTLTNKGVTGLRYGRGLSATGTTGGNVTGFKGLIDISSTYQSMAEFARSTVADALITTNGVPSGSNLGLYGHVLGSLSTDYIDYILHGGTDILTSTQLVVQIAAAVNTVSGTPAAGNVDVDFYRIVDGGVASSTSFMKTVTISFNTGTPGIIQRANIGPFVDLTIGTGDVVIMRIRNNVSGTPLSPGTLRVVSAVYGTV